MIAAIFVALCLAVISVVCLTIAFKEANGWVIFLTFVFMYYLFH